jgi:hypothetical protein
MAWRAQLGAVRRAILAGLAQRTPVGPEGSSQRAQSGLTGPIDPPLAAFAKWALSLCHFLRF